MYQLGLANQSACAADKPHVPWHFPHEFLKYFPEELSDIPLAKDPYAPTGMPLVAWHTPADVQRFAIQFNGTCNETRSRIFRRGYYASVAYTDYIIGMLIDTLDELQVAEKTIVVVFGDHGWQLGEHDLWAKMSMFEAATHIPFIMRAPWMTKSVGKVTWAFTEMVSHQPFSGFFSFLD